MYEQNCMNRFIIKHDSSYYGTWQIFFALVSVLTGLGYAYFAAFGLPFKEDIPLLFKDFNVNYKDNVLCLLWLVFELFFFIDIILNFFLEYVTEERRMPVRDIGKIA